MAARTTSVPQPANKAYRTRGTRPTDRTASSGPDIRGEPQNWRSRPANEVKHSHTRRLQTFCLQPHPILPAMGLCVSNTFRLRSTKRIGQGAIRGHVQSTEGIDQGAIGGELQPQRYAPFSCNTYWIASKHGRCAAVHLLYQSTYSTMTLFSTCSISIDHFY